MKYLIKWDCGYGMETEVVDCESQRQANKIAYDTWREEAETQANYSAEPLTPENAADYDHEDELGDQQQSGVSE